MNARFACAARIPDLIPNGIFPVSLPLANILYHQSGLHQDQHPHHTEAHRHATTLLVRHLGLDRTRHCPMRGRHHHPAGKVQTHPVQLDR